MNLEDAKNKLQNALNTPTWEALKTSFIGRELIQYGATVIFLSDEQKRSIQNNQYPDTADLESLLLYSFNRDFAVDLDRPSFVKLDGVVSSLISPYQARIKSGNVLFTNIDYIPDNDAYMYYQGTIKAMYKTPIVSISEIERVPMTVYYDVDEESFFIKLGKRAMVSSVRAYVEEGTVNLISEYDVLRSNPNSNVMKLKRGFDQSLNLYFGNGKWGKKYDASLSYHIVWLDGQQEEFDETSLVMMVDGVSLPFKVLSTDSGVTNDITYTRAMVKAAIAKLSVAATSPQIISFVKAYPSILDCVIDANIVNNFVRVWVKPVSIQDTIFDDVADGLNLKGEVVTQYQVERGAPLYYYVYLTKLGTISQQTMSEIESKLRTELSYENQPYVSPISSIRINEMIATISRGNVIAAIVFKVVYQEVSNIIELPTRPYRGTIKLFKDNIQIGWDTEGMLYGAFDPANIQLSNLFIFGSFFMSCGDKIYTYNSTFTVASDNTTYVPLNNASEVLYDEDRVLVKLPTTIDEIVINEVFEEGDYSLQKNPTTKVTPFRIVNNSTLSLKNSLYKKDNGVFKVVAATEDSKRWFYLYKYDINNGLVLTPNFSILVTTDPDWNLISVVRKEADMFVFFKEGLRYIANYSSPQFSERIALDNIEELRDLSNVKQVFMNNTITILKEVFSQDKYSYEILRCSGFDVDYNTPKRLILRSSFLSVWKFQFTEQHDIQIMDSSMARVLFKDNTDQKLYSAHDGVVEELAYQGKSINLVVKAGIVSYANSEISVEGRTLTNITVEYESSEPMDTIGKERFPVMNDVLWK